MELKNIVGIIGGVVLTILGISLAIFFSTRGSDTEQRGETRRSILGSDCMTLYECSLIAF